MRFPLFVSARPSIGLTSIKVMVGVGNWRVINEDTTSEIDVYVNDLQVPTPDHSFTCYSISKVHVLVTQAGIKPLDIHVESFDV